MLKKRYTFLVFPEERSHARFYSIPVFYPLACLAVVVIVISALAAISHTTYQELKKYRDQTSEIKNLRVKTAKQEIQIYSFAEKIGVIEEEMIKLQQFDRKLRAITGKGAILADVPLGVGGANGDDGPKSRLKARTEDLIRQMHRDLDRLLAEASVHEQDQQDLGRFFEDSKSIIASTPDTWPLTGPITSHFGYRSSPFGGGSRQFHRGLDVSRPNGTPIVAPADGIVVSKDWNSGYGLIVAINHGYGMVTRYAHLAESLVEAGQRVRRGQKIALVGSSGRVTGPHLHYEVILNGIPVNPMRYLAEKK